MWVIRLALTVFAVAILTTPSLVAADDALPAMFDRRVAPLLARRCLDCHNATAKKGGSIYRVSRRRGQVATAAL